MNTKKEETPRFLLFSLIVRRYDLREVDGVSCRVFDIYPVAAEHTVIEIQRLRARHCGDAHGGAVVFVHAVAIVAARARRAAAVVEPQPHVVAAKCAARGVDPAAEAAVSADLPVFKRAAVQERSLARRKADARTVAHKADVRDVRGVNAARRNRHGAGERRAALAADQVAAEIFHRQSTLVCHRGQLQNVDRLSIRLVRERVEQHVQIVDRRHRVVIFGQRHDRDARDLDCVAQAQRVAVFGVDRPDDVALALFELLGVEARDNHRCRNNSHRIRTR